MRLLLIPLLASGCSATPYAELGLGYQVDAQTDYWVQTSREWQCSRQPQFHGELGLEFDHNWKIGYHHQSWVFCGGHNDTPEVYMDDIRITKKFGGK